MEFIKQYLNETSQIVSCIDIGSIKKAISILTGVKKNKGRLFILGIGGSSSTAGHAVNDFRKICNIESYSATDNSAELTAITNDSGWENSFCDWLFESNLTNNDCLLIFSVGGGNLEKNISRNLIKAVDQASYSGTRVIGIVGRDGGYVKKHADATILVPVIEDKRVTPHTEGISAVILHLLVSHPDLYSYPTKWESTK